MPRSAWTRSTPPQEWSGRPRAWVSVHTCTLSALTTGLYVSAIRFSNCVIDQLYISVVLLSAVRRGSVRN